MTRALCVARLGWRLLGLKAADGWIRCVAQMLGAAILAFCAIALIVAPYAIHARQARADARVPVSLGKALGPRVATESSFIGGHEVTRLLVDTTGAAHVAPPPGIPRLPHVGESFVSSSVAQALKRFQPVRSLLSRTQVKGTISPAGLTSPDEWYAYVGVRIPPGAGARVSGFGGAAPPVIDGAAIVPIVEAVMVLMLIGPGVLLVATASRYAARRKKVQVGVLALVGATPRQARSVVVLECAIYGLLGGLIGAISFALLARGGIALPMLRLNVSASDLSTAWLDLAVAGLVAIVATIGAWFAVSRSQGDSVRPSPRAGRTRGVSLLLLSVGVVGTASAFVLAHVTSHVIAVLVLALATLGALTGLPQGISYLLQLVAPKLAVRQIKPARVLALRLVAFSPGSSARMAAASASGLLLLGIALPLGNVLSPSEDAWMAHIVSRDGVLLAVQNPVGGRLPIRAHQDGARLVLPTPTLRGPHGQEVQALVATCGELRQLGLDHCPNSPAWLQMTKQLYPNTDRAKGILRGSGLTVAAPSASAVVASARLSAVLDGALVIPTRRTASSGGVSSLVVLVSQARFVPLVESAVIRDWPLASFTSPLDDLTYSASRFAKPMLFLTIGIVIGLLLLQLACLVALAADSRTRAHHVQGLRRVGAPASVARKSLAIAAALPALLATTGAVAMAALDSRLLGALNPDASVPLWDYLLIAVTAVAVSGVLSTIAARASSPRT